MSIYKTLSKIIIIVSNSGNLLQLNWKDWTIMTGEAAWREPDPFCVWQEGGNLIVSGHKKSWRLSTTASKACCSWDNIALKVATSKAEEPGDMCHHCHPRPCRNHGHFTGDTGAVLPRGSCKADLSGGHECTGVKVVPLGAALLSGRRWGKRGFSLWLWSPSWCFSLALTSVLKGAESPVFSVYAILLKRGEK